MIREFHEVANIFPMMQGEEFDALKADIDTNGLREPIWLHQDGRIIDGRNRYLACCDLGIEPQYRTWNGAGSLVAFVVSLNLHRRHLTPMQRAGVAVDILPMLEAEAKERQREAAVRTNERRHSPFTQSMIDASPYVAANVHAAESKREASTDSKHMYFIRSGDKVKIGVSISPEDRLQQIKTSNPDAVLLGYIPTVNGIESQIHSELAEWNVGGEWFAWRGEVREKIEALIAFTKNGKSDYAPFHAAKAAAKLAGASVGYVVDMKRYKDEAPEVFELARAGTINGSGARKLASLDDDMRSAVVDKLRSGEHTDVQKALRQAVNQKLSTYVAPMPNGKYRVIYADPPWSYGNTMPPGTTQPDEYYRLMPTAEIAAMPVKDLAEDDAVLFMWTTSPHLEESFDVIHGWGFKYKTSFIWDKVKHNMGHYNSVRHEFLLVCVRGSCPPDVPKLFDSVQVCERTEHSVKPELFREIIDTIYPFGSRLELFARRPVGGWDVYGNEVN